MTKFKVGDKVKCVDAQFYDWDRTLEVGKEYTVEDYITGEVLIKGFNHWIRDDRFVHAISVDDRIADLEHRIETFKAIQRTNDASIKMWQELHQKDHQCLIHMAKRLNKVTAQNVELKRANDRLQEELIVAISQAVKESDMDKECDELQEMFKAMGSE